jgi:phosphoglycolate phosphatase
MILKTANLKYQSFPAYQERFTLFCDFDGPIVDVSDRYYSTYKISLERTQSSYQEQGEILTLNKLTKEQFWVMKKERCSDDKIAISSGLKEEQIPLFVQNIKEIVNHPILLQKDKIQPGVKQALELLYSQGVGLVLVTLRCQSQVTDMLKNYGLNHLFREIYGTSSHQCAYQNNTALKTLLLKKAIANNPTISAYMVGDTEADILAAQSLEITAIALTCGIRSLQYLQQFRPHYLYADLLSTAHNLLEMS